MANKPQLYYAVPSSVRSGRPGVYTDKDQAKRQHKGFRTFTTRAEAENGPMKGNTMRRARAVSDDVDDSEPKVKRAKKTSSETVSASNEMSGKAGTTVDLSEGLAEPGPLQIKNLTDMLESACVIEEDSKPDLTLADKLSFLTLEESSTRS
ncbi:hypothetical protein RQP46_003124 [Phenoliferia psychrophenolica]